MPDQRSAWQLLLQLLDEVKSFLDFGRLGIEEGGEGFELKPRSLKVVRYLAQRKPTSSLARAMEPALRCVVRTSSSSLNQPPPLITLYFSPK